MDSFLVEVFVKISCKLSASIFSEISVIDFFTKSFAYLSLSMISNTFFNALIFAILSAFVSASKVPNKDVSKLLRTL